MDPAGLSAFISCRLIALDKRPGVRPIGVGETIHHVIAKAVLSVLKEDIREAAGSVQTIWSRFWMFSKPFQDMCDC